MSSINFSASLAVHSLINNNNNNNNNVTSNQNNLVNEVNSIEYEFEYGFRSYVPFLLEDYLSQQNSSIPLSQSTTVTGALLLLDMSGFTALSQQLSEKGNTGIESLSRHLNQLFSPIINSIYCAGGDVIKFMGDALLILFSKHRERELNQNYNNINNQVDNNYNHSKSSSEPSLSELTMRAVRCALSVHSQYDYFQAMPGLFLRLHCGISCGELQAINVGGVQERFEFLLLGQPIEELGLTMNSAAKGEIAITENGYKLIEQYGVKMANKVTNGASNTTSIIIQQPKKSNNNNTNTNPRSQIITKPNMLLSFMSAVNTESSSNSSSTSSNSATNQVSDDLLTPQPVFPFSRTPFLPSSSISLHSYIPTAVFSRIAEGHQAWLAEFRRVTTVFLLLDDSINSLELLQKVFTSIQEITSKYRGDIRQLVRDDKGLVCILLFGLFSDSTNPLRAVRASLEILKYMKNQQYKVKIGISTGDVFVGVVGNEHRAEYTAIGDKVNIAARFMAAIKEDEGILTDSDTRHSCLTTTKLKNLKFVPLTPIQLKGRAELTQIYRPEEGIVDQTSTPSQTSSGFLANNNNNGSDTSSTLSEPASSPTSHLSSIASPLSATSSVTNTSKDATNNLEISSSSMSNIYINNHSTSFRASHSAPDMNFMKQSNDSKVNINKNSTSFNSKSFQYPLTNAGGNSTDVSSFISKAPVVMAGRKKELNAIAQKLNRVYTALTVQNAVNSTINSTNNKRGSSLLPSSSSSSTSQTNSNNSNFIHIESVAGMGKSLLLSSVKTVASENNFLVLEASSTIDENNIATPYFAFRNILYSLLEELYKLNKMNKSDSTSSLSLANFRSRRDSGSARRLSAVAISRVTSDDSNNSTEPFLCNLDCLPLPIDLKDSEFFPLLSDINPSVKFSVKASTPTLPPNNPLFNNTLSVPTLGTGVLSVLSANSVMLHHSRSNSRNIALPNATSTTAATEATPLLRMSNALEKRTLRPSNARSSTPVPPVAVAAAVSNKSSVTEADHLSPLAAGVGSISKGGEMIHSNISNQNSISSLNLLSRRPGYEKLSLPMTNSALSSLIVNVNTSTQSNPMIMKESLSFNQVLSPELALWTEKNSRLQSPAVTNFERPSSPSSLSSTNNSNKIFPSAKLPVSITSSSSPITQLGPVLSSPSIIGGNSSDTSSISTNGSVLNTVSTAFLAALNARYRAVSNAKRTGGGYSTNSSAASSLLLPTIISPRVNASVSSHDEQLEALEEDRKEAMNTSDQSPRVGGENKVNSPVLKSITEDNNRPEHSSEKKMQSSSCSNNNPNDTRKSSPVSLPPTAAAGDECEDSPSTRSPSDHSSSSNHHSSMFLTTRRKTFGTAADRSNSISSSLSYYAGLAGRVSVVNSRLESSGGNDNSDLDDFDHYENLLDEYQKYRGNRFSIAAVGNEYNYNENNSTEESPIESQANFNINTNNTNNTNNLLQPSTGRIGHQSNTNSNNNTNNNNNSHPLYRPTHQRFSSNAKLRAFSVDRRPSLSSVSENYSHHIRRASTSKPNFNRVATFSHHIRNQTAGPLEFDGFLQQDLQYVIPPSGPLPFSKLASIPSSSNKEGGDRNSTSTLLFNNNNNSAANFIRKKLSASSDYSNEQPSSRSHSDVSDNNSAETSNNSSVIYLASSSSDNNNSRPLLPSRLASAPISMRSSTRSSLTPNNASSNSIIAQLTGQARTDSIHKLMLQLINLLIKLSGKGVCFIIDDCHELDSLSIELICYLINNNCSGLIQIFASRSSNPPCQLRQELNEIVAKQQQDFDANNNRATMIRKSIMLSPTLRAHNARSIVLNPNVELLKAHHTTMAGQINRNHSSNLDPTASSNNNSDNNNSNNTDNSQADFSIAITTTRPRYMSDGAQRNSIRNQLTSRNSLIATATSAANLSSSIDTPLFLDLVGLNQEEISQLLCNLLQCSRVTSEVASFISTKSGGSPLFASELCLVLLSNHSTLKVNSENCLQFICSPSSINSIQIPTDLKEMLGSRLDSLTPSLQLLIKICSVFGVEIFAPAVKTIFPYNYNANNYLNNGNNNAEATTNNSNYNYLYSPSDSRASSVPSSNRLMSPLMVALSSNTTAVANAAISGDETNLPPGLSLTPSSMPQSTPLNNPLSPAPISNTPHLASVAELANTLTNLNINSSTTSDTIINGNTTNTNSEMLDAENSAFIDSGLLALCDLGFLESETLEEFYSGKKNSISYNNHQSSSSSSSRTRNSSFHNSHNTVEDKQDSSLLTPSDSPFPFLYYFRHPLCRDVCYDRLTYSYRSVFHRKIADFFEDYTTKNPTQINYFLSKISFHYYSACYCEHQSLNINEDQFLFHKAVFYLNLTIAEQLKINANLEARENLIKAFELLDLLPLHSRSSVEIATIEFSLLNYQRFVVNLLNGIEFSNWIVIKLCELAQFLRCETVDLFYSLRAHWYSIQSSQSKPGKLKFLGLLLEFLSDQANSLAEIDPNCQFEVYCMYSLYYTITGNYQLSQTYSNQVRQFYQLTEFNNGERAILNPATLSRMFSSLSYAAVGRISEAQVVVTEALELASFVAESNPFLLCSAISHRSTMNLFFHFIDTDLIENGLNIAKENNLAGIEYCLKILSLNNKVLMLGDNTNEIKIVSEQLWKHLLTVGNGENNANNGTGVRTSVAGTESNNNNNNNTGDNLTNNNPTHVATNVSTDSSSSSSSTPKTSIFWSFAVCCILQRAHDYINGLLYTSAWIQSSHEQTLFLSECYRYRGEFYFQSILFSDYITQAFGLETIQRLVGSYLPSVFLVCATCGVGLELDEKSPNDSNSNSLTFDLTNTENNNPNTSKSSPPTVSLHANDNNPINNDLNLRIIEVLLSYSNLLPTLSDCYSALSEALNVAQIQQSELCELRALISMLSLCMIARILKVDMNTIKPKTTLHSPSNNNNNNNNNTNAANSPILNELINSNQSSPTQNNNNSPPTQISNSNNITPILQHLRETNSGLSPSNNISTSQQQQPSILNATVEDHSTEAIDNSEVELVSYRVRLQELINLFESRYGKNCLTDLTPAKQLCLLYDEI